MFPLPFCSQTLAHIDICLMCGRFCQPVMSKKPDFWPVLTFIVSELENKTVHEVSVFATLTVHRSHKLLAIVNARNKQKQHPDTYPDVHPDTVPDRHNLAEIDKNFGAAGKNQAFALNAKSKA